ncbi:MAG: cyclomaltodextrinase N-terminal domain-containing protein [Prevotellaceae bacterium]|jgi:glycosidase|nr:cyclomaltodextrinase N-terminal domain-containing protein [Prevotellaceae bacterium]
MKKLLLFTVILLFSAQISAQIVDKLEPAQWWVGMYYTEVQILLYGKNIAENTVAFKDNSLKINRIIKTDNPNYLFVYVETKGAVAGDYFLTIANGKKHKTLPFTLKTRELNAKEHTSFSSADAIYLLMPDRFANGNPANDNLPDYYQKTDRNIPGARHGGDIQGIINKVPYIANLGITALWTTPMFENNDSVYSYHHYGTTDYYKIDERLGTTADYRKLADVCHLNGIKLIIDVVPNHCSAAHWWLKDLPAKDWFNVWDKYTTTSYRLNSWTDPHFAQADRNIAVKGWFAENMPDFNLDNPLVMDYLCQAYVYWIETIGIDGIRIDTYPYNNIFQAANFLKSIRNEYPKINIVGECWLKTSAEIAYYQSGTFNKQGFNSQMQSVMDFPLKDVFETAFLEDDAWEKGMIKFYNHFALDFSYRNPNMLMNMLDNHDIRRYSVTVNRNVAIYKMALAVLATVRGYPQIYAGTEIMLTGAQDNYEGTRYDFPGGWTEDRHNAFAPEGRTSEENEIFHYLQKLLFFRKSNSAVQTGEMKQFVPQNGVYVYFRYDEKNLVMVAVNNAKVPQTVDLERFNEMNILGAEATEVTSGGKYKLDKTLIIPAKTALVLNVK